jgi:chemotaxis signal transduction protein
MIGVTPYRGDVVPVYGLERLLDDHPGACALPDGGMLLLVRRAGQLTGLLVAAIDEIGLVAADETGVLDIDGLPFPTMAGARAAPGAAPEPKAMAAATAVDRGLGVVLAGRVLWLPLAVVVEVIDRLEAIAVPWADPLVPAVVMRGGAMLPVVRVDRLLGLEAMPNGPLIVVRRGSSPNSGIDSGLVAFRVDAVTGIASRPGNQAPLDLDALLAGLPDAGTVTGRAAAETAAGRLAKGNGARAYLSFMLADQMCLLPMEAIRAVAEPVLLARLPIRSWQQALTGLRAIRGQIVPVVDPRGALGLPTDGVGGADIVVVAAGVAAFVVPTKSVDGIVRLADDAIQTTGRLAIIGGVVKVGGRLAWLLTPAGLASAALAAAARGAGGVGP